MHSLEDVEKPAGINESPRKAVLAKVRLLVLG